MVNDNDMCTIYHNNMCIWNSYPKEESWYIKTREKNVQEFN